MNLILTVLVAFCCMQVAFSEVAHWTQCGGEGYSGDTDCGAGWYCSRVNQWHCQCQQDGTKPDDGPGDPCGGAPEAPASEAPASEAPAAGGSSEHVGCDMQNKGHFHWGAAYDGPGHEHNDMELAPWMGYDGALPDKHVLDVCKGNGKTPYYYGYVIAFEARKRANLQDCNVDPNHNLCSEGANFIRQNRQDLVNIYSRNAKFVNDNYPKDKPVIWHLEPDFHQYCGDNKQHGGPLGNDFCKKFFQDIVHAIKQGNPCSKIVWDVSPWVKPFDQWWGVFKDIKEIDYVGTSGGCAQAGGEIKDGLNWSDLHRITGKKIFADCGYGVAGAAAANCGQWSGGNLKARINDGVIGVMAGKGAGSNPPSWAKEPIQGA